MTDDEKLAVLHAHMDEISQAASAAQELLRTARSCLLGGDSTGAVELLTRMEYNLQLAECGRRTAALN